MRSRRYSFSLDAIATYPLALDARGSGSGGGGEGVAALEERRKRRLAALDALAVYALWAVFTWFIFTYGMLIYKLLGADAEASFARSWGVTYGISAASEWKDIALAALKGALYLAVLERLFLSRPLSWLEVRTRVLFRLHVRALFAILTNAGCVLLLRCLLC
jgi:hypothetical protein